MIEPNFATIVMIAAAVLLLIVIPLLDGSERFGKFISLRFTLVASTLIMAIGCVLDFSHLTDSSRNIVLMGSLVLAGIFVVVRSIEKCQLGGKTIKLEAHAGDKGLSATIGEKEKDHGETEED